MLGRAAIFTTCAASALLYAPVHIAEAQEVPVERKFAPIYDDEVSQVTRKDTPQSGDGIASRVLEESKKNTAQQLDVAQSKIQQFIGDTEKQLRQVTHDAREYINQRYAEISTRAEVYGNTFRENEKRASETVADLKSPAEEVLPNAIYVLSAGLGTSVLTARRNFVVRLVAPWAVGLAAFNYLLPQTFENTRALVWRLEKEQLPAIAKTHADAYVKAAQIEAESKRIYDAGEQNVQSQLQKLRETVREWTGL